MHYEIQMGSKGTASLHKVNDADVINTSNVLRIEPPGRTIIAQIVKTPEFLSLNTLYF